MKRGRGQNRSGTDGGGWDALAARAEAVVREVVASLPDDLRTLAEAVPVFYEADIARHWLRAGV